MKTSLHALVFALAGVALPSVSWAQFADQATYAPSTGGSNNAQTVTIPNVISGTDIVGVPIRIKATYTNTGAMTLNISGTGVAPVYKQTAGGLAFLTGNEIIAGQIFTVVNDGGEYQLIGQQWNNYYTAANNLTSLTANFNPANGNAGNINNTAYGFYALASVSMTGDNTGVGAFAGSSLNTGTSLTAVGYEAADAVSSGNYNVAVGERAGSCLTTNSGMVAIGHRAMGQDDVSPAACNTGSSGTLTGNTAVGAWAFQEATTGEGDTFIGANSGLNITTGTDDVGVGFGALCGANCSTDNPAGNGASYAVAIGYLAGQVESANGFVLIGYEAGTRLTTATYATAVGFATLATSTVETANTAVGYNVLSTLTAAGGGSYNSCFGAFACESLTTGTYDTAVGENAMGLATSGSYSSAVGAGSVGGGAAFTGSYIEALGYNAGTKMTSATRDVVIGDSAGAALTSEADDTFIGSGAGQTQVGYSNTVAIGYQTSPTASNQVILGNSSTTSFVVGTATGVSGTTCSHWVNGLCTAN